MRVTEEQDAGVLVTPASSAPRVYALDIVVPEDGDPLVVDVNGARSGVEVQRLLYGDDRVQEAVLTVLAEAGGGVVTTVSQTVTAPLQDRFSAARLRAIGGRGTGWYEAAEAYVPAGDPHARGREQAPAEVARRMGIDFRSAEVAWHENRFVVAEGGRTTDLRSWNPVGALWPYAWDQRVVGLPAGAQVCNPLPYALPTTNKLLAAWLTGGVGIPNTRLAGLWKPGSAHVSDLVEDFAATSALTVVKPGVGRRSFGVVLVPTARFGEVVPDLGLVADPARLERAAELTVIASLWGQGAELLALAQPYVEPRRRRHPGTGRWHTSVARATVVVEEGLPRCVDVCALLAPRSHDRRSVSRDSLMLMGSGEPGIVAVDDDEVVPLGRAAEKFIERLENAVRAHFSFADPVQVVRAEVELLVGMLDHTTDGPVRAAWEAHRETISGYEALCPYFPDKEGK